MNLLLGLACALPLGPDRRHDESAEEYDCYKLNGESRWLTNTASAHDGGWNVLDRCSRARCCACLAQIESKDAESLWSCLQGVPDVPAKGNVKSALFAEVMPSHYMYNSSVTDQKGTFLGRSFVFFSLLFVWYNWLSEVLTVREVFTISLDICACTISSSCSWRIYHD